MHIVIVGNGVAGISCALAARKRDASARITVIGDETPYFFSRTALMYAFMNRQTRRELEPFERHVFTKERIELLFDAVVDLDADEKNVTTRGGRKLPYDRLVLAIGAVARQASWPGLAQATEGVVNFVGMYDLDRCEALVPSTREAVVVGGGLIGIELVESLVFHGIYTTFLVREPAYWPVALGPEESARVVAGMQKHGVHVRLSDEVASVVTAPSGRVARVDTVGGEQLNAQMLGICVGVTPAIERMKSWRTRPETRRGIVVNEQFATSLPDVYAIGDCAEISPPGESPFVELIWYSAKRHGVLLGGHHLFGDTTPYRRPVFFNSSKFFDIEYTTVGAVMECPDGTPTIYLSDERRNASVRIVHDGARVLGFNMLGARWDHEVLVRWVEEKRAPAWVEAHLTEAQFDVEFGRLRLERMLRRELPLKRGAN